MDAVLRAKLERIAVSLVLKRLKDFGWEIIKVDDGGDEMENVNTIDNAMDVIFSVCDSWVMVGKNGKASSVRFVLGNDPDEVVADYGINLETELGGYIGERLEEAIQAKLCEMAGI